MFADLTNVPKTSPCKRSPTLIHKLLNSRLKTAAVFLENSGKLTTLLQIFSSGVSQVTHAGQQTTSCCLLFCINLNLDKNFSCNDTVTSRELLCQAQSSRFIVMDFYYETM